MDTDRNLLFAVLALQADLIDPEQLAKACVLWTADRTRPLAAVLVGEGWLTEEDRADVDKLLRRKLAKHGGDARASLAELVSDPVRQTLATVPDDGVRRTLDGLTASAPHGHVVITTAYTPAAGERYTLSRLHATGGIGRVWLARDASLGRDVALKELRPERAGSPTAGARFLREAQVTGQLEHPGIVPVYEVGKKPEDDAPFYTMRFVRGRTLAEAAAGYHGRRRRGEAGPLELRELLTAFLGVCQAVAYAHSRGVLHRDLKPQNVVLGDFGEVVVLDWGLAKLGGEAEEGAPPMDVPAAAPDGTLQGQVLGTPAYMSPEQAEGRLDLLDARGDVYGLGAVLYEVLTGAPPFTGAATDALLRQVVHEPPAPPRSVVPTVPRALEAVCLKALAKLPAGRYATVKELAADVQRWLADEPVAACRDRMADRFARWVRRNRSWAWASAVSLEVVALVTTAATVAIYLSRAEAVAARAEAEARQVEAQQNLTRANKNLRTAQDAVRDSFHQIAASDLASVPQAGRVRLQLGAVALTYNERFLAENPDNADVRWDAGDMYRTMGSLYVGANQPEQSLAFYKRSLDQFRKLDADAQSDDKLRSKSLAYQLMLAKVCREAGAMLLARGRHAEARPLLDEGLTLLSPNPKVRPPGELLPPGSDGHAVDFTPSLRPLWPADPLSLPAPPAAPTSQHEFVTPFLRVKAQLLVELARQHLDEGRAAEALAIYDRTATFFRATIAAADLLTPKDGLVREYHNYSRPELDTWYLGWSLRGRAIALTLLNRAEEADAEYTEALKRLDGKPRPDDRYLLASILLARGVTRSALPDLDRALALLGELSRDFGRAGYRREYARALIARGGRRGGDRAAAEADYRSARAISEELIAGSERKPAADDLANLADALVGLGGGENLRHAVARYEEALAICPNHAGYRRQLDRAKARGGR